MEKIDYKTLIEFLGKFDEEAARIFNKLKEADLEAKANILDYGHYSDFKRVEWDESYEDSIVVRYYDRGYDLYATSTLMIPVDILFDDEKIDKWIKSEVDKAREEKELEQKAIKKRQEEKERQEYERLKEKFGK